MRKKVSLAFVLLLAVTISSPLSYADGDRKHGDVENIGNRDVVGRIWGILPNFVSLEKEIAIGQDMSRQFEQTARLMEDPVVVQYIDRLGQDIVKHSDAKVPFHIKTVDTDEVNSFAFPGGFFYINKGLILAAENESELAGVIAHEISHVCARHATKRLSKAQYLQFATIPALFVGGYWTQTIIQNVLGLGINLELLGITRESEKEADQLGIQYLWNTGYDPGAFVTFFEKLLAQEKSQPGKLAGFFRTHPSTPNRIAAAMDEQRYLPEKDQYKINSSEFDRVKARLIAIDNIQKAGEIAPPDQKKPTLKRRTNTEEPGKGEEPEEGKEQKKRPTLKRPNEPPPNEPPLTFSFAAFPVQQKTLQHFTISPVFTTPQAAVDYANTLNKGTLGIRFSFEFFKSPTPALYRIVADQRFATSTVQWQQWSGPTNCKDAVNFANKMKAVVQFISCWNPLRNPVSTSITAFYVPSVLPVGSRYKAIDQTFALPEEATEFLNNNPGLSTDIHSAQFLSEMVVANQIASVWRIVYIADSSWKSSKRSQLKWHAWYCSTLGDALVEVSANPKTVGYRIASSFDTWSMRSKFVLFVLQAP